MESFLRLELNVAGIDAKIIEQNKSRFLVKQECRILFADLPDSDPERVPFDAGMDLLARELDLKQCSTAVIFAPWISICFRNIDLPFSSKKQMAQVLPFELETILPHDHKTCISDFHRLNLEEAPHQILTASILESDIETYFSSLARYGIKPVIITHKGYAAAVNFLKDRSDVNDCIFLHLSDQGSSTLVLVKNRVPCRVRVFKTDLLTPEKLIASVSRTLIGFEQQTGVESTFDVFVSSENTDLDLESIQKDLEQIPGCVPQSNRVDQMLETALPRERIEVNLLLPGVIPFSRINYLFNFCKEKYGSSSFLKTYFRYMVVASILALFAFGLSIINIHMDISNLERKIAANHHQALLIFTSTFPEKKKIQDPFLQMKANVQAVLKKSGIPKDTDPFIRGRDLTIVKIISEFSRAIDASTDMEISRLLFNNGRLVLSGSTDNFNSVNTIKSQLESSDLFKKVTISSAAADKKGDRVNFKFIIEM